MAGNFYGSDQARIHHERFGDLADDAATLVADRLRTGGHPSGLVTDLGCGSGILARRLLDAGYAVHGVDLSPEMVALARATAPSGQFSVGSVHDVVFDPSVAVTAIGEVLQYATDARTGLDTLRSLATRVFAALVPGGVFAFDLSLPGRNLGQDVRHVFHDHGSWLLGMHGTEGPGWMQRRIVILVEEPDGRYRRVDETHRLVLFTAAEVTDALERAGFDVEVRPSYATSTASTPVAGWSAFVGTKPGV
jgi:SAM-dependent methyltransferase